MNIPDDALMAAYRAIQDPYAEDVGLMVIARAAVEAAAERIAAHSLREYADSIVLKVGLSTEWVVEETVADIRLHADTLDPS